MRVLPQYVYAARPSPQQEPSRHREALAAPRGDEGAQARSSRVPEEDPDRICPSLETVAFLTSAPDEACAKGRLQRALLVPALPSCKTSAGEAAREGETGPDAAA